MTTKQERYREARKAYRELLISMQNALREAKASVKEEYLKKIVPARKELSRLHEEATEK